MSNFEQVQGKLDETKRTLYDNVDKLATNVEVLSQTNETAHILVDKTEALKNESEKVKRRERMRQIRCYLFIALFIVAIIGVIIGVVIYRMNKNNSRAPAPSNAGRKLLSALVSQDANMFDGLDLEA